MNSNNFFWVLSVIFSLITVVLLGMPFYLVDWSWGILNSMNFIQQFLGMELPVVIFFGISSFIFNNMAKN